MSAPDFHRHHGLVFFMTVATVGIAVAMGLSDRDWLPWLEQGPLDAWLNDGNSLVVTACMMGIATTSAYLQKTRLSRAFSCLAAILAGILWILGQIAAAYLMCHWYSAPGNVFLKVIPILGGVLLVGPLLVAPYISAARRTPGVAETTGSDQAG